MQATEHPQKKSEKTSILRHISVFTAATQISQLISMILGVVVRNLLGPFHMGIWSTLQLVMTYSSYTVLGTTSASAREIPYHIGKRDEMGADEIKNEVATFGVIVSVLTGLGIAAFVFLFGETYTPVFFWGLIGIAFLLVLQRVNNVMVGFVRAYKLFTLASHQTVISAVVNCALVAILVYFFKIYGFIAAMALSYIFNIGYIQYFHKFKFRFQLSSRIIKLIQFGLPLMLIGIINALLKSVDKIVIIRMLGFQAMGWYSVAIMASEFLARIPSAIDIILIPHFEHQYGRRDRIEDVRKFVDDAMFGFFNAMPIVIGLAWLTTPIFITYFLPQYQESILAAQFLMLSVYFFALSTPYGNFLVTLKKHMWLFPITVISLVLAAVLDVLVISAGFGITGVAIATAVSQFLYFVMLFIVANRYLGYTAAARLRVMVQAVGRFSLLLGALLAIQRFFVVPNLAVATAIHLSIFLFLCIPAAVSLNRRFLLLNRIKSKFTKGVE
jgi:O-antigen/teichoic acid export membrane protein